MNGITVMFSRTIAPAVLASILAITGQVLADEIRISNDGTMRTSFRDMSVHGIGVSRIEADGFVLAVRGQFRLLTSVKLTRVGDTLAEGRPKATPVWMSLVAMGEIELEIPGVAGSAPSRHHAKTAVYLVKENRWILDSKELVDASHLRADGPPALPEKTTIPRSWSTGLQDRLPACLDLDFKAVAKPAARSRTWWISSNTDAMSRGFLSE